MGKRKKQIDLDWENIQPLENNFLDLQDCLQPTRIGRDRWEAVLVAISSLLCVLLISCGYLVLDPPTSLKGIARDFLGLVLIGLGILSFCFRRKALKDWENNR